VERQGGYIRDILPLLHSAPSLVYPIVAQPCLEQAIGAAVGVPHNTDWRVLSTPDPDSNIADNTPSCYDTGSQRC
jgi:hypothetical protein